MKISDYLTSGEAAALLGITKATLNNWAKSDKLKPFTHPITGFKLYRLIDIHNLLEKLKKSGSK